jgi:hypothetical protein
VSDSTIRIPNAADFSPNQVRLRKTLELARDAVGDKDKLVEDVRLAFYSHRAAKRTDVNERLVQQRKSANNILISLRCYQLLDGSNRLTELGRTLLAIADDEQMAEAFAKHILLNLHGIEVIYGIWALQKRAEVVKKLSLARQLNSMGIRAHQGGEISGNQTSNHYMLLWLQQAKVLDIDNNYQVDEEVFLRLCGVSRALLDELRGLSRAQRNFLLLLHGKATAGIKSLAVREVVGEMTEKVTEDQHAKELTRPLSESGWIAWDKTELDGRGGKSGSISAQQKLLGLPIAFLRFGESDPIPPNVRKLLDRTLEEIEKGLDSAEASVSGVALEALAVRMAYDLGLVPRDVRSRKQGTKDAEVDVLAETQDILYARWLFQCKKQNQVNRDVLVRELGLASLTKTQVIVLVTTGKFKATVLRFADHVTRETAIQVVLVNGDTVRKYLRAGGGRDFLRQTFQEAAARNGSIKRGQPSGELDE